MKKIIKISAITLGAILFVALVLFLITLIRFHSIKNTSVPRLDVITEDGAKIKSKEDYVKCIVSLSGTEEEYEFSELEAGIRGRGNSTWGFPKKPYRIKFEEKQSIFGEKKNKSWVLLAMYNDFSYIKDRLAFSLADSIGSDNFVPSYNYVELYLNGKYKGLYLMTDQIDENKGRTDVKEDFTESDVEVPFLVELDGYAPEEGEEGKLYFTITDANVGERYYNVKYPEADERYTQAQFDYIVNYVTSVDNLCKKDSVTIAELSEYIDVQSFIDFYLVQEIMGQNEINYKSVYMHKVVGEKMKMGPIWDFDYSVNGPYFTNDKNMTADKTDGLRSAGNWFAALYNNSPEFRTSLSARYLELRDGFITALNKVYAERAIIEKAAVKDRIRWHMFHFDANYEKRSAEVVEWVKARIECLDKLFILS